MQTQKQLPWVQTFIVTKRFSKPTGRWRWECLYIFGDEVKLELWVCHADLKEDIVNESIRAFGDHLQQIVRTGAYPEILYTAVPA